MSFNPNPYGDPFHQETIEFFKDVGKAEVNQKIAAQRRMALHAAAGFGNNLPEVKRLLSIGAGIHSKDITNNTPLHYAAYDNRDDSHFDVIKMLIKSGANVNAQNHNGTTPLHFLIRISNVKTVNLLLDFGAKVNSKDINGETPLSRAISNGYEKNLDNLKLLLDRGSDVNNSNNQNMTPLHHACVKSSLKHVKFLVINGAYVNSLNYNGRIPLMMVLEYFYLFSPNWVRFLIKYSDVNTIDISGKNIMCLHSTEANQNVWKTILEHVAKMQALDFPIHQNLNATILGQPKYQEYFKKCTDELKMAKSTKLKNCWVTFFNLLLDSKRKLKNYAGNQDLVQDFYKMDCLKKFQIYGSEILKKVDKGIQTRKSFDKSTVELSYCLPIFNPTHLIIKDVLDCLTFKDYNRLISEVRRA